MQKSLTVFIETDQKLVESNLTPQNFKNVVENENTKLFECISHQEIYEKERNEEKTALIVRTKVTI